MEQQDKKTTAKCPICGRFTTTEAIRRYDKQHGYHAKNATELKNQIADLKEEKAELLKKLQEANDIISSLNNGELTDDSPDQESMSDVNAKLQDENARLQDRVNKLVNVSKERYERIAALEREVKRKFQQITNLTAQLDKVQDNDIKQLNDKLAITEAHLDMSRRYTDWLIKRNLWQRIINKKIQ